jgi:HupE / UreJ protein
MFNSQFAQFLSEKTSSHYETSPPRIRIGNLDLGIGQIFFFPASDEDRYNPAFFILNALRTDHARRMGKSSVFSNVLKEMALSRRTLAVGLFSFNGGVELGQLRFVCFVFPIVLYLSTSRWKPQFLSGVPLQLPPSASSGSFNAVF